MDQAAGDCDGVPVPEVEADEEDPLLPQVLRQLRIYQPPVSLQTRYVTIRYDKKANGK